VRGFVERDRGLLGARMSRSEHGRTPLHHAATLDRADMVRLLIDLGADVAATDDTGATPLTAAALRAGAPAIVAMLERAGAKLDLLGAVSLGRYDVAERLLAEEPGRLGPDGRDTIALHVLVARQKTAAVQWLIAHGVDVNARRRLWDCNSTALHVTRRDAAGRRRGSRYPRRQVRRDGARMGGVLRSAAHRRAAALARRQDLSVLSGNERRRRC